MTAAPSARCPDPLHAGSVVVGDGTRQRKSGKVRKYRCDPLVGNQHRFTVVIATGEPVNDARGCPACPSHPGSHVTRNGVYGRGLNVRQQYKCDHTGRCSGTCRKACSHNHGGKGHGRTCAKACGGTHNFAPMLPREHVEEGDQCDDCLELRGVHRGEMAVARRQRFPGRIVAEVLFQMSSGMSYAKAGMLAFDRLDPDKKKKRKTRNPPATPAKRPPRPTRFLRSVLVLDAQGPAGAPAED